MSKIELDDQILAHPKFLRAVAKGGSAVIHMWLGLRAYCSQHLTDGHIPDDMLEFVSGPTDSRSRKRATFCLAECNLLHRTESGWFLHDYLDHASSREQVLAWRKANRDRKRTNRKMSRCDGDGTDSETPSETASETPLAVPPVSRVPSPSLISEHRSQPSITQEIPDGDRAVGCPPDLRLTNDQCEALKIGIGIQDWQIDTMTVEFVAKNTAGGNSPRSVTNWRKTLSKAITSDWRNPANRPKKIEAEQKSVQTGTPPNPGMEWHKDGYWFFPRQPKNQAVAAQVSP